jgi:hypothetical protein
LFRAHEHGDGRDDDPDPDRRQREELHAEGVTQTEIARRIQRIQSLVWRCVNQHRPGLSLARVSSLSEVTDMTKAESEPTDTSARDRWKSAC